MSYNDSSILWSVGLNEAGGSLGNNNNWHDWTICAIGDFAGDGKDDIVMFHAGTGIMAMIANGNADIYAPFGQLNANEWEINGCGDYNGDGKDDLLVQQISTGLLGYYSEGIQDVNHWNSMGFVDSDWTVIA